MTHSESSRESSPEDSFMLDVPSSLSFAPNVTPIMFEIPTVETERDLKAPVSSSASDASGDSASPWLPSQTELNWLIAKVRDGNKNPRKSSKMAKDPNHVPRPPNPFFCFRCWFLKHKYVPSLEGGVTAAKVVSNIWHKIPGPAQREWYEIAKMTNEVHKDKHPSYKYKPDHSKRRIAKAAEATDGGDDSEYEAPKKIKKRTTKRKGLTKAQKRELEKEKKEAKYQDQSEMSAAVADFILQGLSGKDLDDAVAEQKTKQLARATEAAANAPIALPNVPSMSSPGDLWPQTPTPQAAQGPRRVSIQRANSAPPEDRRFSIDFGHHGGSNIAPDPSSQYFAQFQQGKVDNAFYRRFSKDIRFDIESPNHGGDFVRHTFPMQPPMTPVVFDSNYSFGAAANPFSASESSFAPSHQPQLMVDPTCMPPNAWSAPSPYSSLSEVDPQSAVSGPPSTAYSDSPSPNVIPGAPQHQLGHPHGYVDPFFANAHEENEYRDGLQMLVPSGMDVDYGVTESGPHSPLSTTFTHDQDYFHTSVTPALDGLRVY